jgi:hypothetical protein
VIVYTDPQGTDAWLAARRGVVTASKFKTCRERLKNGDLSKAAMLYAMDCARERMGGKPQEVYQSLAMRTGTEQEPFARAHYEALTGHLVYGAGFVCTDDRKFGASADGFIGDEGGWECKTLVSSDTLFTAAIDGDISAYMDQINGCMWITGRKWWDLSLWCPDMPTGLQMTIIRIERDDDAIEALEADLVAFERLVSQYEQKLAQRLAVPA